MLYLAYLTATTGRTTAFAVARGAARTSSSIARRSSSAAFFNKRSVSQLITSTAGRIAPTSTCIIARSSTVAPADLEKNLGVEHPSFDIISTDIVNEFGAYCTFYRHKKSGAELLSVSTDDDNKCFGITFRTPPSDSTGVPHILEHSVLCGSRKYKTKDPFVQLLQGSLQTFLNAFTYPDRTCYVVASQNTKDFYNLINVYADAVFHPRAVNDPMVHAQEGWHLELEEMDQPLTYKGVVYNEMKGVYSSPDSLLQREAQQSIFPDNTYGVDSGGDPVEIPNLSFEQFANFHQKFYHPANSRIFFAGDDDVAKRLEIMDEYLQDFGESPESKPGSVVQYQKKVFDAPQRVRKPYPAGADQPETHMLMVNWLVNDKEMTPVEEITITILDHLLMGTSSSILRKTLMESGLGDAITGGGLMTELLQGVFMVGLKGVKPEDVDKVEELVVETLKKVAEEGFSEDAVAASMNTIEFDVSIHFYSINPSRHIVLIHIPYLNHRCESSTPEVSRKDFHSCLAVCRNGSTTSLPPMH